jgi:hypothetical protein
LQQAESVNDCEEIALLLRREKCLRG